MPTDAIDRVILQLEAIMDDCIRRKSKGGYFAALYHKVTCAVREGIVNGDFEDGPRMEKLDVLFAGRYLHAWQAWQEKKPVSASWEAAFGQLDKKRVLVLQHLLLGINAHINLDLGIATVETAAGSDLSPLRRDFIRINTLLSSLLLDVLKDINRISPLSSLLGLHARNSRSMLINFTIESARDGAWGFADDLSRLDQNDHGTFIGERDQKIRQLGDNLARPKGLLRFTALIIRLFEWNNAAKVTEALRRSKKIRLREALAAEENKK